MTAYDSHARRPHSHVDHDGDDGRHLLLSCLVYDFRLDGKKGMSAHYYATDVFYESMSFAINTYLSEHNDIHQVTFMISTIDITLINVKTAR